MKKCTLSDVMFYSMDGLNSTYVIIRFELDQPVRKEMMSEAFRHACGRFPYFQTRLQQLESGYALVQNEKTAEMHEDPPDYILSAAENDGFLYRFSVWENTVSFSMFHGLADGSAAIAFIKVILAEYYTKSGEAVESIDDLYDIDGIPVPEETAEPLDSIPADVVPAPYMGSIFYHLPEKPVKDAASYTFTAEADRIMQLAASFDGSPNAVAAVAMAKAISEIHPEAPEKGIDVGISINAKPIIGIPKSHWPFLQTSTFHFDEKAMAMDDELLHTCVRGRIFADCTEDKLFPALAGVRSIGAIFDFVKDDKARKLLCLKSTESPRASATVSYAGVWGLGSIGKHIRGMYTFCDACVPILEINYNEGIFYFTLSSQIDSEEYAKKLREYFNRLNCGCSELKCVRFNPAKGKKDKPKFGLNFATLKLILGIRAFKKSMKKSVPYPYDPETEYPALHVSICTGETSFGFKSRENGHFREAVLVKNDSEIEKLKKAYGLERLEKDY